MAGDQDTEQVSDVRSQIWDGIVIKMVAGGHGSKYSHAVYADERIETEDAARFHAETAGELAKRVADDEAEMFSYNVNGYKVFMTIYKGRARL